MRTLLLVASVISSGCTTTFYGSSRVKNGVAGCKAACDAWGMDLAGMVKMGEYSDGCICQVKPIFAPGPAAPAPPPPPGPPQSSAGSVIPPAAGVVMQMQAQANAAAAGAAAHAPAHHERARTHGSGHGHAHP